MHVRDRGSTLKHAMGWSIGVLAMIVCAPAHAQSQWDPVISNSHWYVTVPQMLAYASSNTSFANPFPVGDQTLWALGASVNGVFSGTGSATLAIGPIASSSTMTIQGMVTPAGQITMSFITDGGPSTVGLGMMQEVGGVWSMEMQMITGTSLLVTHWAYMMPYDPATFTPPAAQAVPSNASPQWAWTQGTPWRLVSPTLFGSTAPGSMVITTYKSGYYWGQGIGPRGGSFTFIGSITPQGKVLFSALPDADPQLTSLYGEIAGDPSAAGMLLGVYDSTGAYTGEFALAMLVPSYATAIAASNPAAVGAAGALYQVASTPQGLFGPLAPAVLTLNGFEAPALSVAIGQTLPVLAGNAARATADTQRGLQDMVAARLAAVSDGDDRNAWMRPFGALARQSTQAGFSGYEAQGGGFIAGLDGHVNETVTLGGWFAYSRTALTGHMTGAPGNLDVSSYALGLYGTAPLPGAVRLDLQIDGAFNANSESRFVGLAPGLAAADYDSVSLHAGAALRRAFVPAENVALSGVLRLDYLSVNAQGYTETGAGALSLAVQAQTYQELFVTAGMRADYQVAPAMTLSAHAGVGYNMLDTTTRVTSSFLGGGASFVTYGADLSPWLFTAGLGLAGTRVGGFDVGLHYDLQASPSGLLNQIGSLSLKLRL